MLGTAVTLVSAYIALRNVDFAEVWTTLKTSDYWWLGPALAVMALAIFVRVVRWAFLFVRERRPPIGPLSEALLVGHFFNTVLPARAGDLARVAAINPRAGTSRAELRAARSPVATAAGMRLGLAGCCSRMGGRYSSPAPSS